MRKLDDRKILESSKSAAAASKWLQSEIWRGCLACDFRIQTLKSILREGRKKCMDENIDLKS